MDVFSYTIWKPSRYAVGGVFETARKIPYLTASPEKALADKVWSDKRFNGLRIIDLNVEQFRREVTPFIRGKRALDVWSRDFFSQAIKRIISISYTEKKCAIRIDFRHRKEHLLH